MSMLFSRPMVSALLRGQKTQTRRGLSIRRYPGFTEFGPSDTAGYDWHFRRADKCWCDLTDAQLKALLPYVVGDKAWVRETYYQRGSWKKDGKTRTGLQKWAFVPADHAVSFAEPASYLKSRNKIRPEKVFWYRRLGRFMPRRYSRMTLTLTDVRVEQLQGISHADAMAEGISQHGRFFGLADDDWGKAELDPVKAYQALWNAINGDWDENPWIIAFTFTVEQRNIDDAD